MDVRPNTNLTAQVLGVSEPGEANPEAGIVHVSGGTFKCGSCDTDHPYVGFAIGDRESYTYFFLADEDALEFAQRINAVMPKQ